MKSGPALSMETRARRRIPVQAGGASYEAVVGSGLLAESGSEVAAVLRGPRCVVIADENTAAHFAPTALASFAAAGFQPTLITVPAGEKSKSLEQVGSVCDAMTAARLDRSSFVVALGGGVVGDLAGFAAAIYHRGIPHVQVPTTLLAQVDSSIGGKTAVNTAAGKNLLGAVHQPALVLADVDVLSTLPRREFTQGFAEIIKHAAIADAVMFELLRRGEVSDLAGLVARNIAIKAIVVAEDERDVSGRRAILNFGHTIGHAIERAGGYQRFLHGEAISLGIAAACKVSVRRAGLPAADRQTVITTLEAFGLPTRLPADFPRELILPALAADKKFERGEVRFVVAPKLGSAYLTSDVTMDDLEQAIAAIC
ncbi:MAG: 3-dehydroquinate synthase [Verrucomicrobiota bacterium]|nr:3-dehydroquinate synthase [Verrucomicrobiota bacterium]